MSDNLERGSERYQVVYCRGEREEWPHITDTQEGGIVRFGKAAKDGLGNQLFSSPERAEEVARLLNSGVKPEEIKGIW